MVWFSAIIGIISCLIPYESCKIIIICLASIIFPSQRQLEFPVPPCL